MEFLKNTINDMKGIHIRKKDIIARNHPNNEQFFIFLSYKREDRQFYGSDLESLASRINKHLNEELFKCTFRLIKGKPQIYTGYSIVLHNPLTSPEKLINKLMEESKKMAKYQKFRTVMKNKEKIQELIYKEQIPTVYHPIIEIKSHKIMGYEALTRAPEGSEYENPYLLLKLPMK